MTYPHWPLLDLRITTGDLVLAPLTEADLDEVVRLLPADLEQNPNAARFGLPDDVQRGVVVHQEYWRSYGTWTTTAWRFHLAVRRDSGCSACRNSRATTSRPCAPSTRRPGWWPAPAARASARRCAARCWRWPSTISAPKQRSPRPGTTTLASLGVAARWATATTVSRPWPGTTASTPWCTSGLRGPTGSRPGRTRRTGRGSRGDAAAVRTAGRRLARRRRVDASQHGDRDGAAGFPRYFTTSGARASTTSATPRRVRRRRARGRGP